VFSQIHACHNNSSRSTRSSLCRSFFLTTKKLATIFLKKKLTTKEKIKSLTKNKRAGKRDDKNKTANIPAPSS